MKKNSREVKNNEAEILDRLRKIRPELKGARLRPMELVEYERKRILNQKLKY